MARSEVICLVIHEIAASLAWIGLDMGEQELSGLRSLLVAAEDHRTSIYGRARVGV